MADQIVYVVNRALDINGEPVPGALATFYAAGTNTAATIYADANGDVVLAQPLEADASGVFPQAFASAPVKVLVTDADGVLLDGYPLDPAYLMPTAATGAGAITFDPTAEIPVTNVQAAIERVQANIAEPLADFGLGVTGNAGIIANLDAADTASGWYRYDGTTTGTFPSGVTASAGGIVQIRRETAAAAHMALIPRGEERGFIRDMTSSTWGAWLSDVQTRTAAQWLDPADTVEAAISPAKLAAAFGAPGAAPRYVCRAWVNFNGTGTPAIRRSGNVSSITDNGTGDYTVNFTTDMPASNYCALVTAGAGVAADPFGGATTSWAAVYTTGSVRIGVADNNSDDNKDVPIINVAVFT